jgi:hypothetical protein
MTTTSKTKGNNKLTMTDTLDLSSNTNINYKVYDNVNNIKYGITNGITLLYMLTL